jgi:hypothetical protein
VRASIPTQLVFSLDRAAGLLPHISCASSAVHPETSTATQQPTRGSKPRNKRRKRFLNYFANYPNVRIIPHSKHLPRKCSVKQVDWLTNFMEQNLLLRSYWLNPPHCITVFSKAPTIPCSEPQNPLPRPSHPSYFLDNWKYKKMTKRPENITRIT